MKKLIWMMDKLLEWGAMISLSALIVTVSIQIFSRIAARFSSLQPPAWTEEVTRLCFIYIISFAAGLAVRDKAFVNVEVLITRLPGKARRWLELIIHLVIIFFMIVFLFYSVDFVKMGSVQQSVVLQFPLSYMFCGPLIISFFIIIYSVIAIGQSFREIVQNGNKI